MSAYTNPVIPGFNPDPSVCRVGDNYFLATSTFTWFPGVPIYHSTNLTDWSLIGNALDRESQLDLSTTATWASLGIYAPTLRHHNGRFYMITTLVAETGYDNFFVTAEDPGGPWSEPQRVDIGGIDPDIAWDEGDCWVHFSAHDGIKRCRIDDTTGERLSEVEPTWSGTGLQYPEAPHLYNIDDQWYLLIAEGGTERGHAVSIARGPAATGPWESCPHNPILSHRSTDLPIQNTGHADILQAADGSWWMACLGVRPRGVVPRYHVAGRETFLTAVHWDDGWPIVATVETKPGEAPPGANDPEHQWNFHTDFDDAHLDPSWIARRSDPTALADLTTHPGALTLSDSQRRTLDHPTPVFIGRRQQHHAFQASTQVEVADGEAGLAVVMDEHAHYAVAVEAERILVRARIGPVSTVVAARPRPPGPITLLIDTAKALLGPDDLRLGYSSGDKTETLATLDGRYLATESAGGFIGRIIGVYATGGTARFDWYDYRGTAGTASPRPLDLLQPSPIHTSMP